MNSRASPILLLLFFICLVLAQIPLSLGNVDANTSCSSRFNCGNMTGVGYPFWGGNRSGGCGCPGLELNCDSGVATIEIMQLKYRVLDINLTAQLLQIARQDYMNGCLTQLVSTTLNSTLFDYAPGYGNLTFSYGCPPMASNYNSSCQITEYPYKGVHVGVQPTGPEKCNTSVTVPVLVAGVVEESMTSSVADQLLRQGFEVKWEVDGKACRNCTRASPPAGAPWASPPPPVGLRWNIHSGSSNLSLPLKISIGVAAGAGSIVVIFIMICSFRRRRECLCYKQMVLWKKGANNDQNVDVCIRNHGFLAPKRYSYSNVKKMTNSFTDKLGQGGYGSVYKGKLTDGHLVAVKVLSESKGNGEEFINEVASISRTSHINIVTLLGFCYERTKRALIYELMPNGSLDKFIYDRRSSNTNSQLEWNMLYKIAVGIARGLKYLHRGCTTRILHFDIKPQNILLDKDFCPKISDFGLAKLCQKKESVVSMVGARGTAGYIAPEVFCRTFGAVSHKSDVYSYGMMVLEMVGGRKNIDVGVVRTSEIYFPHWIYDHVELGEVLNLHGVMTTEEEETARKMILVGLWCIQTNPSNRPSISKVVEMLEGSLQSIQIPPKPFLFSPTRSPQAPSTASLS